MIAQQSGNRANESHLAICLSALEAQHGDPLAAFDYLMLAIRNFQDSGHAANMRVALAMLTVLFDRLARCEAAATIAGFAFSPLTAAFPSSAPQSPTYARCSARRPTSRSPARVRR